MKRHAIARTALFAALMLTPVAALAASQAEMECQMTQMSPLSTQSGELSMTYIDTVQKTMKLDSDVATKRSVCDDALAIRTKGEAIKAAVRNIKACKDEFQIIKNVDIILKDNKSLIKENCGPGEK